ncbi:hypothetical protein BCAH820_B0133 (plasmid) [Bacillus cereus AH820]|uniref:Uncharacterized protein n=1 Tax=Bacillus cereus (strain AH820) TaxID=405535 RepID=B7JTN1_BACC0|nr:hypothetical protein BCAH820_B0133 [Bacillus cereus AH820]
MAAAEYFAPAITALTKTKKAANLNMTGNPVFNTFPAVSSLNKKFNFALSPPKIKSGIVSINL